MPAINVSDELYAQLQEVIRQSSEYKNVEALAEYVLSEVAKKKLQTQKQNETYSKEDEEKIKERLQNLGYLD